MTFLISSPKMWLRPFATRLRLCVSASYRYVRAHEATSRREPLRDLARRDERILVSADTDFGTLLARTHATSPSFVLIRRLVGRRVHEIARVIIDNLGDVEEDLLAGAVVVFGDETMRIRRLPIG